MTLIRKRFYTFRKQIALGQRSLKMVNLFDNLSAVQVEFLERDVIGVSFYNALIIKNNSQKQV